MRRLDIALLGGALIIIPDWLNSWWLLDIVMLFYIMGEFYMITTVRELQDAGTSYLLQGTFLGIAVLISIMWMFSGPEHYTMNILYYTICAML